MDKARLERYLADGWSLDRIGEAEGKHPSTVGYWLKKHGLKAFGASRFAQRGALVRSDLEDAISLRLTVPEMAQRFDRNVSTIRYWLRKYELDATYGRKRRARTFEGPKFQVYDCRTHGETEFVREGRGYYRCKRCRSQAVGRRRQVVKDQLVKEFGGCCVLCGYKRCTRALSFHHLDPSLKKFHIAEKGHCRSIARCREEAKKCVLLCSNCHAEVEGGFVEVPKPVT